MKSFLYALKVWITVIPVTFIVFFIIITFGNGAYDFMPAFLPVAAMFAVVYTLPLAMVLWLSTALLYKKDIPLRTKKCWLALWGVLSLLLAINFIPASPLLLLLSLVCMTGAFLVVLWLYKLPSRQVISVTDHLKGRHILLRVQENNLLLHGIVVSELNIWPIQVKLYNQPDSLLELRSFQPDELFTTLTYQNSVKVKAFTAERGEFLFYAVLELDHTLN